MIRASIFAGSAARVELLFTDPDTGAPLDVEEPVTIEVRFPAVGDAAGTLLEVEGVRSGVGTFVGTFVTTDPGTYVIKARSSGNLPAVTRDEVQVRSSSV